MITAAQPSAGATRQDGPHPFTLALAGNPNAGKTTLFNGLTGLRARTANFPGTTVERKVARLRLSTHTIVLVDLPGMYSLEGTNTDEQIAAQVVTGQWAGHPPPDAILLVVDATNLERNLFLASQVLELGRPTVVALNMMDVAVRKGIAVDLEKLRRELGCPVVPVSARLGAGMDKLKSELERLAVLPESGMVFQPARPACSSCAACPFQARYSWTEAVAGRCVTHPMSTREASTEKIDGILTHPALGVACFAAVMTGIFFLIFQAARIPMELIDRIFAHLGGFVLLHIRHELLGSLVADGLIAGVGGILVFLPQICILFFCLTLLEDTGYLARAAFVMDRLMGKAGLPGKAFVPLLSAHACALPAIMSTRVIEDPRDRLVTILVAPLMTCSARIPVYSMVIALLFPTEPWKAALTFTGSYAVGAVAALVMAWVFKRTLLPGQSRPLVLELPHYRFPSLRNALYSTIDRASVFVRTAGTVILCISLILWALATFPRSAERPAAAAALDAQAAQMEGAGNAAGAAQHRERADELAARHQLEFSLAGRMGRFIEPVLRPLGFDWQIGIGLITSFAAREVIVSTLAVVYGVGAGRAEKSPDSLYGTLREARRPDGRPVFTTASGLSLLIFYILAAQCLPTQAVTRRETGGWKWPAFQIAYMTGLAYFSALAVYQLLIALGVS
jgi:ferrous iron transport protein B